MPKRLALIALVSLQAHGWGAQDLVRRVQESYESVRTLEARFEQTYRSRRFDEKKASGKLSIAKPGRMRWDYDEPKGKVLVSNGNEITLYDPEDGQAMVSVQPKGKELPVALTFLAGEGKLAEQFACTKIESLSKESTAVLDCTPKEPIPNVSSVVLTVSLGDPVSVTATKIVDELGGENEIRFSRIRRDRKISEERFKFKPPKGTQIVSMTEGHPKQE